MSHDLKYATTTRPEIHDLIPSSAASLLDVGCNDGGFGAWFMAERPGSIAWGVEYDPVTAGIARETLSHVIAGSFPAAITDVNRTFDCVTFNHVLEHLVDPWGALRATRSILAPGGRVVGVLPNLRYLPFLGALVFRGAFEYTDTGLLDSTHLRFFTRSSIKSLLTASGYDVIDIRAVNAIGSRRNPLMSRATSRILGDVVHGGMAFAAAPASVTT